MSRPGDSRRQDRYCCICRSVSGNAFFRKRWNNQGEPLPREDSFRGARAKEQVRTFPMSLEATSCQLSSHSLNKSLERRVEAFGFLFGRVSSSISQHSSTLDPIPLSRSDSGILINLILAVTTTNIVTLGTYNQSLALNSPCAVSTWSLDWQ